MTESELVRAVDTAFQTTGDGLERWADPHPDRSPAEEEYSRVTNPAKWRIIGARADAWLMAAVDAGLAVVEPDSPVDIGDSPLTFSRVDLLVAHAAGALPLVVARSSLGDVTDAGITIAVGEPATVVTWLPDCGCDACDSGSQAELDRLDLFVTGVMLGRFRRLTRGTRRIEVIDNQGWTGLGLRRRDNVAKILADPRGWAELTGASWLGES